MDVDHIDHDENIQDECDDILTKKQLQFETFEDIRKQATLVVDTLSSYSKHNHKDPDQDHDLIDKAAKDMLDIWSNYYSQLEKMNKDSKTKLKLDDELFRRAYMDTVTEAFADELDDLRHGRIKDDGKNKKKKSTEYDEELKMQNVILPKDNEVNGTTLTNDDIKVLATCLESGMDIWTEEERRFLVMESQSRETNDKTTQTIHERRRKMLFGE